MIEREGRSDSSLIHLIMCPNIKKYDLIFQFHVDYPDITRDRKSPPSLQAPTERMIVKWLTAFATQEELVTLGKLFDQFWLQFYTLSVVFFKVSVKDYRFHMELR